MDLFKLMIIVVPFVIIYTLIDWEIAYYKKYKPVMKYRTPSERRSVYWVMFIVAVLALLVAIPFIVLGLVPQ